MDAHQSLAEAIAHLKAGRKTQAQSILGRLVQQEPSLVDGWLWLSACFDERDKQMYCLKKVLALDPGHEQARRALAKLQGVSAAAPTPANAAPAAQTGYNWPQSGVQATRPPAASAPQAAPAAGQQPRPGAAPRSAPAAKTGASPAGKHFAWYQVWLSVLILPNENILRMMLDDPEARPGRGYLWVFTAGTISFLLSLVVFSLRFDQVLQQMAASSQSVIPSQLGDVQTVIGYFLIGMMVASPLAGGMCVLGTIIVAAIYQFVAQFVDGKGSFGEMVYLMCAIAAPMYLVSALISALPQVFSGVLGFIVSLYSFYLTLAALKAVNRFGWGSSCITVIAVPVLVVLCSCLCGFLFSMMSVPSLENIILTLTPGP